MNYYSMCVGSSGGGMNCNPMAVESAGGERYLQYVSDCGLKFTGQNAPVTRQNVPVKIQKNVPPRKNKELINFFSVATGNSVPEKFK